MSVFLLYFRTAWNDHFPATTTTNYISQTYTSRHTFSGSNVYVSNCLFRSISSSGYGGALYCTSASYFLVESTSFFSIKSSSSWGGAIHFENTDSGASILYKVCGYDCSANPSAHFAYIRVKSSSLNENYVNYSSITRCVNEGSSSNYMLCLCSGKNNCPSINMSMNKCGYYSSFYCEPYVDSSSVTCSLSFSTLADNIAIRYICIYLWRTGANYEIKSCNILRNTQGTLGSDGTIRSDGNLMIKDSCILENVATNIFYVSSSSYTITLSNCTVDKTTCNQNLVTQNTVTKSFILALNHMSTHNCHSEYDSAGTLIPIIQTPSPSKKQIRCFTIGNFFGLSPLRDSLSLSSILMFNFIHQSSFGDSW
jgi:hypothetical protein